MDFLRIAVCEDFAPDAERLVGLIENSGIHSELECFTSGEDFLRSFSAERYDIIFMDIYLDDTKGLDVVRKVRETDENVAVAFTTKSIYHTLESYRLGALKYIEKPVEEKEVRDALELALAKRKARESITLPIDGRYRQVVIDGIFFFEIRNMNVMVHTAGGVLQVNRTMNINSIEERICSPPFYRCHHSYIVNMRYVRNLDEEFTCFIMKSGDRVHIRRELVRKMKKAREDYLFAETRKAARSAEAERLGNAATGEDE